MASVSPQTPTSSIAIHLLTTVSVRRASDPSGLANIRPLPDTLRILISMSFILEDLQREQPNKKTS